MRLFARPHAQSLALLVASTAAISPIHAQTSDKALAEATFREARELLAAGRTEEACARFEASQRLEPSVGTLMNLALCQEQLGRTASAWATFVEVTVQAARVGQTKREAFAKERAAALEALLARVSLVALEPSPELVVRLDGRTLEPGSLGVALPLDPGPHRLEASAPGRTAWQHDFELAPGPRTDRIEIPPLALETPAPTAPPVVAPAPAASSSTSATPSARPTPDTRAGAPSSTSISPLVWIGLGTTTAGLVVGATTGVMSLSMASELEDACPGGVCPTDRRSDADEALVLANVSNVGFGVAAAGLVVGVVGLVLSDFDATPSRAATGLRVGITDRGTLGIVGRF